VLSVLLRYTDSDYPFGIFKLFLKIKKYQTVGKIPKSIKLILLTHIYTTINFPGLAHDLNKERRS
jgi:hypothetical protein